jgi:hypothetical protein
MGDATGKVLQMEGNRCDSGVIEKGRAWAGAKLSQRNGWQPGYGPGSLPPSFSLPHNGTCT